MNRFPIIFLVFSVYVISGNGSKVRKLIDFLDKDAPVELEKVPNYNEESISFKRNKNFNPCLENANICSNNGKCKVENGNFYCVCPITHYGKICEHIADQTNCEGNLCQNNATCVSVRDKKTIVNTVLLAELRDQHGAKGVLTEQEMSAIDMEVNYECICQKGFFGALCDESEADRSCQEVFCLGRGKGTAHIDGKCECECENRYFGERCEQLSACFDTQCENGALCEDHVDLNLKTVGATCHCPKNVEIVGGTVSGDNCEHLEIPGNTPKDMIPCESGRNSFDFFRKVITSIDLEFLDDIWELEQIQDNYHDGKVQNGKMDAGWCENGGKCVPEIVRVRSGRAYYLHRCECTNPLTEGFYCEYKKADACSLSREEVARGARWDEKCTDIFHGACVDIHGEPKCVCKPDYTGESCEVFDPCARHPCKHGDCIPIPSSADSSSLGTNRYQCLCPLSAKLDAKNNECVEIADKTCEPGVCGHGRCVPCDTTSSDGDDVDMPLCDEKQRRLGHRCLCEAGFLAPDCKVPTDPCWHNLCQNSATCQVNQQRSYDCICLNGTRGTLCEIIDDSCDAFGKSICVHGACVNDEYFHRGFACDCRHDYEGVNCDVALPYSVQVYRQLARNYQFTVPLFFCFLSLLVVLILVLTTRRKR